MLFSSIVRVKPRIVTPKAISFRYNGIVSVGLFMGVMLFEIINPAKMLPTSNHLIEFISCVLFSLMSMSG
jgi:dolichyl-phosphate-mannose--protein O-mannosyl transferase